jgi:hypothetical protein
MKEKYLKFTMKYLEKGEEKYKHFKIKFISLYNLDRLNELQAGIMDVRVKIEFLSDIQDWLDSGKLTKEKKKELLKEKKLLKDMIEEYGKNGYLDKRFDTIKSILIDNGYEDDSDLMDYNFWYKKVHPNEIKRFIIMCLDFNLNNDEDNNN